MSLVDDRGRIAGRINLLDAAVVVLVAVMIPAAYGSYLLFRSPIPKLLSIAPNTLYQGNKLRLEIEGRDLRPFLRVSFNDVQGRTFLIGSTKSAMVDLPELSAGSYDVVLYDYSQEVDRLPKALTILPLAPTPMVEMEVSGFFFGLPAAAPNELKPGLKFSSGGSETEILSVGIPGPGTVHVRAGLATLAVPALGATELPATLRVRCGLTPSPNGSLGCTVYGPQQAAPVAPESVLTLAGPARFVNFQIEEVHLTSAPPVSRARVRFVVSPELLALMKPGDRDSSPSAAGTFRRATITALGIPRVISSADAGRDAPIGGVLRAVDASLSVPVDRAREEWTYKDAPFKAGAPLTFETPQYVIHGEIVDMTAPVDVARGPAGRRP